MIIISGTACNTDVTVPGTPTPTDVLIITATLPPTQTPPPSLTPEPATATPEIPPVEGTTTSQLNVRAQPSTAAESLGLLPIFSKVQIIGKDAAKSWWMIQYPSGPNGVGWVTAQYVQVESEPDVPVTTGQAEKNSAHNIGTGTIVSQVNVRSGPGTDSETIGTLNQNDVVLLTGKTSDSAWLQFEFPNGPDERGWISSAFVQADGVESLPIITEAGQIVGTGTAPPVQASITPTLLAAPNDGDSAQSPAITIQFGPSEVQSFNYSSDVSSPDGDAEDWLQFSVDAKTGQASTVSVILECSGNTPLAVELWQNGRSLQRWDSISCGRRSQLILSLFGGPPYSLRLLPGAGTNALNYVRYTVIVQTAR
ncbi:MAG: hypothetical protein Kow002_16380 [Anaerolineales bacterium]